MDGKIKPGGTIIEGTSGNTGMGLGLCNSKGIQMYFTLSDCANLKKRWIFYVQLELSK